MADFSTLDMILKFRARRRSCDEEAAEEVEGEVEEEVEKDRR